MHLYGTSKDLMKTFTVFHKIFRGAIMKHECICVLILIFIVRRGIVFETKKTPHGSRTPQSPLNIVATVQNLNVNIPMS